MSMYGVWGEVHPSHLVLSPSMNVSHLCIRDEDERGS